MNSGVIFSALYSDTHCLEYISQAPWYLDTGGPSLDHQRRQPDDRSSNKLGEWYDRGKRVGAAATKFRKGACDNCGALTHKTKDCLERPRKKGARYTGRDIQPDEIIQDISTNYDAKRDRWNGYDPAEYGKVYEEYAAIETARRKIREEEIDNQTSTDLVAARKVAKVGKEKKDDDFGSSDEEDADEDKYAEAADAVGQKMDAKTRITVRNLRIREDTAKYLMNLDPESAYYDPKTRSMRDAPHPEVQPEDVSPTRFSLFQPLLIMFPWLRRPLLLAKTSYASPVTPSTSKSSSYLPGSQPLVVMTFISMQTRHKEKSCMASTKRRKRHLSQPISQAY